MKALSQTSPQNPEKPKPPTQEAESSTAKVTDSGLVCLLMLSAYHGVAADAVQLQHEFGQEPFSPQTLLLAARHLGLTAKRVRQPVERLAKAVLPAMAIDREGQYLLVARYDATGEAPKLLIQRAIPAGGQV